ncbi:phosphatidylinositol mannoside acyltransferase [Corynebacterium sp. LK2510]|uniref:phosphatidylinositol mannoside acyltransferase n=1 Tax=Corynebacterium sp. LK2510 TaxID=3110472 RepID=UPI0034CDFFBC
MDVRDTATTAAYLAGWKVVGAMPSRVAELLFDAGADAISHSGRGMDTLRRNLTRVVGAENVTRALVRDSVRSYARYWREAFQLPRLAGDPALLARLDEAIAGRDHIDAALDRGRGVVLTLPHSGNWDMAGVWAAATYGGFTTVAERLRPEALFDAFVDYRTSLGFEVLPHAGGTTPPRERLEEVLRSNGVVCLMGERDLKGTGIQVNFFGERTTIPAGSVALAQRTGASLLVAHTWFTERTGSHRSPGWGMKVEPEVEVTEVGATAQRVTDLFAANIAAHPRDWHMLQPMWPADRPATPRRLTKGR